MSATYSISNNLEDSGNSLQNLVESNHQDLRRLVQHLNISLFAQKLISITNGNSNVLMRNRQILVEFNQNDLITKDMPKKLKVICLKYNGLCDLICNKVLIDDLLGKGDGDFLKEKITATELNNETIVESHLCDVYSSFRKIVAFGLSIYPDNIFSIKDQWNLVNKNRVNSCIFFNGLKNIENNTTLKVEIVEKTAISFKGHSLLIKKINENEFIFFDPNEGEYRNLSQEDLEVKINAQLSEIKNKSDLFILNGDAFIKILQDKNKNIPYKDSSSLNTEAIQTANNENTDSQYYISETSKCDLPIFF